VDDIAWSILDPLVATKLKQQFGGRLRVAVSPTAHREAETAKAHRG